MCGLKEVQYLLVDDTDEVSDWGLAPTSGILQNVTGGESRGAAPLLAR